MGGWVEEPGQPRRGSVSDGRTIHRAGGAGRLLGSPSMGARVGGRGEGTVRCLDRLSIQVLVSPMADIHSAAQKNDVAFIQASDVVDALVSRSGGDSLGTPRLHRDDAAACCSDSTGTAATSMHQRGTPLPNPICPF